MNDQEIKGMLGEQLELLRENNIMLKKIRRVQKLSNLYRIFYWVIVLGISFGAYYYIQPYVNKIVGAYSGASDSFNKNFTDVQKINSLFE